MAEVPDVILSTYKRVSNEYPSFVALKRINDKYYLYSQTTRYDKKEKKQKTVSKYLGRITAEGVFIKKSRTSEKDDLEIAKEVIEAHGGKVVLPETAGNNVQVAVKNLTLDEIDDRILTAMSMNARASAAFIETCMSLEQGAAESRIKQLEKRYGIRYVAEIDTEKLGYSKFMAFGRFLGKVPTVETIKTATKSIPNIQLVATLKGKYDLFMYILAKNNEELTAILTEIELGLSAYKMKLYNSHFHETYNFIPIRDEFLELVKSELKQRGYRLLKELNNNGDAKFAEIDKKYAQERGRSSYAYYGLINNGILKRVTINMSAAPIRGIGIVYASFIDWGKFAKNRSSLLLDISEDVKLPTSKYILVGDVGIPRGGIFFIPLFAEGDLECTKERLDKFKLGTSLDTYIVSKVIIGSFCIRKFDNGHSRQYDILVEKYGIPKRPYLNYHETGRMKKESQRRDIRGLKLSDAEEV